MPNILIVNGSLGGSAGNTAELLALAEDLLSPNASVSHLELVREPALDRIVASARAADGFIFGTGTYWDSWGSPLQRFLEMTAHTEASDLWLGKPAGVLVTANSVGAKGVLSRLIGVLNVYGMSIPPLAGFAYTFVNHIALPVAPPHLRRELWTPDDVKVVCHNLLQALGGGRDWLTWPTNQGLGSEKWLDAYSKRV